MIIGPKPVYRTANVIKTSGRHTNRFTETQNLQSSSIVKLTMAAEKFRLESQVAGMDSVYERMSISAHSEALGRSEYTQAFAGRDIHFAVVEDR